MQFFQTLDWGYPTFGPTILKLSPMYPGSPWPPFLIGWWFENHHCLLTVRVYHHPTGSPPFLWKMVAVRLPRSAFLHTKIWVKETGGCHMRKKQHTSRSSLWFQNDFNMGRSGIHQISATRLDEIPRCSMYGIYLPTFG